MNSLIGLVKRVRYNFYSVTPLCKDFERSSNSSPKIIVSLTSYGRRVTDTVYYTILSLFDQTHRPDKIVLWLDWDNWNEGNIPNKLKNLQAKGLDIRFCEDIRSYKKLIPTLELYPDDIIITVDDDVIYSSKLIERLYEGYKLYPHSIQCTRASRVRFSNQRPIPYKLWKKAVSNDICDEEYLFPVGIGGVLYPPYSLHKDILDKTKFIRLSPFADDIWFWYMARLQGTAHHLVKLKHNLYSFDAIYQALHRGSALTHLNVGVNKNDLQLAAILEEYDCKGL